MKNFKVGCVQIASGPNIEANLSEVSRHIADAKDNGANNTGDSKTYNCT